MASTHLQRHVPSANGGMMDAARWPRLQQVSRRQGGVCMRSGKRVVAVTTQRSGSSHNTPSLAARKHNTINNKEHGCMYLRRLSP